MDIRHVKNIPPDRFDRPRVRCVDRPQSIYADISLGEGDWHTVSRDGEPIARIRDDIQFVFVKTHSLACCEKAVPTFCVCTWSFRCPEHGERHHGTHD